VGNTAIAAGTLLAAAVLLPAVLLAMFVSQLRPIRQSGSCCVVFAQHYTLSCVAACRYLSRLLLLHGRWSYMRNKEVVLYSFYKNWAYVLVYVYLQFEAGGCHLN
jgi:hypothetical protein